MTTSDQPPTTTAPDTTSAVPAPEHHTGSGRLSGEGTLSATGVSLKSAQQILFEAATAPPTSINLNRQRSPAERTAAAAEQQLEIAKASQDGIRALVDAQLRAEAASTRDGWWMKAGVILAGLAFIAAVITIFVS